MIYTIKVHNPSGETYALRYNDDGSIDGVAGPLHWSELELNRKLEWYNYENEDAEWANAQSWEGEDNRK